ncbi:hypothetical protein LEP1GSC050_3821 [Leptospira broomii serovar Hurstbridge str. 5399]|uniref:Uncharacterized protein n=1 Tax=Leptospira broomii serovar Hurstbridge str. 5399 TaxID=1049789 RepID=T0GDR3_9LEPT|nr:hypothetical protein LEP1GSC050_3821 [Leptospira broomii serovar Hurstbridge str. 5399]
MIVYCVLIHIASERLNTFLLPDSFSVIPITVLTILNNVILE